jgi:hypothetical protein
MLPWEIWAEIFDHLLYDPVLANSSPFYPGCNLHTALSEWHDEARLQKVERRRRLLRLVCQMWKAIADQVPHQFYQLSYSAATFLANPMFLRASRMHLCVKQDPCRCPDTCECALRGYQVMSTSRWQLYNVQNVLENVPPNFQPPLRTLILSPYWWPKESGFGGVKSMKPWLSRVSALLIPTETTAIQTLHLCPNLTFLSIQLKVRSFGDPPDVNLTFPKLTGLVIYIWYNEAFQVFKSWNLPKLQHLWINYGPNVLPDQLVELFEKQRPALLSLSLHYPSSLCRLPPEIWSRLPNLLYLGLNSFKMSRIATPPSTHPLRTLGFLQIRLEYFPRERVDLVLSEWHSIKVIADVHRWEEYPFISSRRPEHHFHPPNIPTCRYCIEMANFACSQHGVRYEDRHGRSLKEFMASTVKGREGHIS